MKIVSKLSYYGLLTIALKASVNITFYENPNLVLTLRKGKNEGKNMIKSLYKPYLKSLELERGL